MEGESQPAPPVQQDPIDLQFAFLDVVPYLDRRRKAHAAGRTFRYEFWIGPAGGHSGAGEYSLSI